MPKTIKSERDKLTPAELANYQQNLAKAQKLRKKFLKKRPAFYYGSVFTEARAGGVCRTKFWLVNKENMAIFKKWFDKKQAKGKYLDCKVEYITAVPWGGFVRPSISIHVGTKV